MPIHWKIFSKKFLLNIFFFTGFFLSLTIFFKLSRLTKYFLSGSDGKELLLLLGLFVQKCFPIALAITSFASAYLVVTNIKKNNEINAFSALGLHPKSLFTPLIFISIFISILNLAISFIVSPSIKSELDFLISKKKEQTHLLNTFSNRFSRYDLYVSMNNSEKKDIASDFLLINTDTGFFWMMCDEILETDEGLYFKDLTYFKVTPEDGFDTILISKDKNTFASKKTIYSFFPYSMIRVPTIDLSNMALIAFLLYLCNPIIFTILGISFALKGYTTFSFIVFFYTLLVFAITTTILSPLTAYLTLGAFTLALPLYFLEMHKCKMGRS